jgi:hypothetical protein
LVREEPRAALPGRGIPLITTDLWLRRLGMTSTVLEADHRHPATGVVAHRRRLPFALQTGEDVHVRRSTIPGLRSWHIRVAIVLMRAHAVSMRDDPG